MMTTTIYDKRTVITPFLDKLGKYYDILWFILSISANLEGFLTGNFKPSNHQNRNVENVFTKSLYTGIKYWNKYL